MATEIRQYACCIDNIKAEKIFKVTSMVLESILLIPVFVLLVKALRSVSNTECPDIIDWLHNLFLSFQRADMAGLGVAFCTIVAVILALLLIVDSVLLVGSIKQHKVTLIVGLVLDGIAILGLMPLLIYFGWTLWDMRYFAVIWGSIIFVFKVWTFVIGVGAVQEVIHNLSIKQQNIAL